VHELSIAEAIVAVAERNAKGRRVAKVEVQVGHLRQVVPSSLEFAFELVTRGTSLDGAELEIEEVPTSVACRSCGAEGRVDELPFACPSCGGVDVDVTSGDELLVVALELEEKEQLASRLVVSRFAPPLRRSLKLEGM
jgi:hydrogenase nickel incorporation protein HypA/HybF